MEGLLEAQTILFPSSQYSRIKKYLEHGKLPCTFLLKHGLTSRQDIRYVFCRREPPRESTMLEAVAKRSNFNSAGDSARQSTKLLPDATRATGGCQRWLDPLYTSGCRSCAGCRPPSAAAKSSRNRIRQVYSHWEAIHYRACRSSQSKPTHSRSEPSSNLGPTTPKHSFS